MHARRIVPALIVGAAVVALALPASTVQPNHVAFTKPAPHVEPPITVTESRSADDAAITSEVVHALRNDASLDGRIGVQTTDGFVELSGIVTSPGQRMHAERDAKGIDGVRNVNNLMSTRMGAQRC